MEREACVCDHGLERSDLCAEIIIIIIKENTKSPSVARLRGSLTTIYQYAIP